jgi:hypothetical protein
MEVLINFILYNNLVIDKSTYITVIMGQLTIYGILLTFYQFIASFQYTDKKSAKQYLGYRITEYYANKKIWIYRIVQSKVFVFIFFVEILVIPFMNIWGIYISKQIKSVIYFGWYTYIVIFFLIFLLLFLQSMAMIFRLKSVSNIMQNKWLIKKINRDFLKKSKLEKYKKRSIDILIYDLENLKYAILMDDEEDILRNHYDDLFIKILNLYLNQKKKEIESIEQHGKISKNQVAYIYNDNCEFNIIYDLIHDKYINVGEKLQIFISEFHLSLKFLNIRREQLSNKKPSYNMNIEDRWKDIAEYLYKNGSMKVRERLISTVCKYMMFQDEQISDYYKDIFSRLTYLGLLNVRDSGEEDELFVLLKQHIYHASVAEILEDELLSLLISYNEFCPKRIIGLLNVKNRAYIFIYLFLYYSIYSFRSEWKYIKIKLLETLVDKVNFNQIDTNYITEKLINSNISHRFDVIMLRDLIKYINDSLTGELLENLREKKTINVYYFFVLKICVFDEELLYKGDISEELQIEIIHFLSNHNEIMALKNVQSVIYKLRWYTFSKFIEIPPSILDSLKALILTDIELKQEFFNDEKSIYLYDNNLGKYALLKHNETNKNWIEMQSFIRKAFIAENCSVEEYIEKLEKIVIECGFIIEYIQKEKMKQYLFKII